MDSILIRRAKLLNIDDIKYNDYELKPYNIYCINFCGRNTCKKYEENAIYFEKPINYQGTPIQCLVQLSKLYNEDEFYHLFDIDNDLSGFRYGLFVGIVPYDDKCDNDIQLMKNMKLEI